MKITTKGSPVYRESREWLLLAFFGLKTAAHTLVLTWRPPSILNSEVDAADGGDALALSHSPKSSRESLRHFGSTALVVAVPHLLAAIGAVLLGLLFLCWGLFHLREWQRRDRRAFP